MGSNFGRTYYNNSNTKTETVAKAEPAPVKQTPQPIIPPTPPPPPEPVVPPAIPDSTGATTLTYVNSIPTIEGLENHDDKVYTNNLPYTDENKLINDIIVFNQLYAQYIKCNTADKDSSRTLQKCTSNTKGDPLYKPTDQEVLDAIKNIQSKVNTVSTDLNGNTKSTGTTHTKMMENTYPNILALRNELDIKLKELYLTEDSISQSYNQNYDSTMYTGILLTGLATSMLYLVFVKI
jgi:hypothetical protein